MSLCSTVCQAVAAYEIGLAWDLRMAPPLSKNSLSWEMILLLISDYAVSRIEEIAMESQAIIKSKEFGLPAKSIRKRWEENGNSLFYAIVHATSLFQFAAHGIPKKSQPISERLALLNVQIRGLFPERSTYHTKDAEVTIYLDPLHLPRIASTSVQAGPFNPYDPLHWGNLVEDIPTLDLWTNPRSVFRFTSKEDQYREILLPPLVSQIEWHFIAPMELKYRNESLFCASLVIQRQGQGVSVDGIFCLGNQGKLIQLIILPIARAKVNSHSAVKKEAVCDWLLCADSVTTTYKNGKFHFAYRRKDQPVKLSDSSRKLLE